MCAQCPSILSSFVLSKMLQHNQWSERPNRKSLSIFYARQSVAGRSRIYGRNKKEFNTFGNTIFINFIPKTPTNHQTASDAFPSVPEISETNQKNSVSTPPTDSLRCSYF